MIERRIGLLFACFLLLLCVAIARAAWMQGIQGGTLSDDAQSQHTQTVAIPGQRGRILDRNGKELAVSEDAADVVATPYQVKDPAEASRRLARVLDVSKAKILSALADRSAGFAYIARQVDLATAARVRKLKLDGISTLPSTRRIYPEGQLAAQVIGTVGVDGQGLTGLEAADNDLLGGANGEREQGDPARDAERRRPRGGPAAVDRRGDPGPDRQGARQRRPDLPSQGRNGDRHGPPQRQGLGDGGLAQLRSERSFVDASREPAQYGDRLHV
jgi:cell division protein FtsI/penicillin-binding protein 2